MSDRPEWYAEGSVTSLLFPRQATIEAAQILLRVPRTGLMDTATTTALRGIQRLFDLPVTGALDLDTAKALDKLRWVDGDSRT